MNLGEDTVYINNKKNQFQLAILLVALLNLQLFQYYLKDYMDL
jgi:hypothetical protein